MNAWLIAVFVIVASAAPFLKRFFEEPLHLSRMKEKATEHCPGLGTCELVIRLDLDRCHMNAYRIFRRHVFQHAEYRECMEAAELKRSLQINSESGKFLAVVAPIFRGGVYVEATEEEDYKDFSETESEIISEIAYLSRRQSWKDVEALAAGAAEKVQSPRGRGFIHVQRIKSLFKLKQFEQAMWIYLTGERNRDIVLSNDSSGYLDSIAIEMAGQLELRSEFFRIRDKALTSMLMSSRNRRSILSSVAIIGEIKGWNYKADLPMNVAAQ